MKYLIIAVVLFTGSLEYVNSFSSGVPPLKSVCQGMTPQHDEYKPQTTAAPYAITLSSSTVKAGGNVEVTIKSTAEDTMFKGFYLQGRDNNGNPVGSFVVNKFAKAHSCGGIRNNAAHHADGKQEKSSVTITWQSPDNYEGDIQFIGTFVKDFVHIWAGVKAEVLKVTKA